MMSLLDVRVLDYHSPTVEVDLDCGLRPLQIASADQWSQVKRKKEKKMTLM